MNLRNFWCTVLAYIMQWCTKIDKYEVCTKVTSFKSQQMIGLGSDNYQTHGLSKESLPERRTSQQALMFDGCLNVMFDG